MSECDTAVGLQAFFEDGMLSSPKPSNTRSIDECSSNNEIDRDLRSRAARVFEQEVGALLFFEAPRRARAPPAIADGLELRPGPCLRQLAYRKSVSPERRLQLPVTPCLRQLTKWLFQLRESVVPV